MISCLRLIDYCHVKPVFCIFTNAPLLSNIFIIASESLPAAILTNAVSCIGFGQRVNISVIAGGVELLVNCICHPGHIPQYDKIYFDRVIVCKGIASFTVAIACCRRSADDCPPNTIFTFFNIKMTAVLFLCGFPCQLILYSLAGFCVE